MRAIVGLAALLVVLAGIGVVARRQLDAADAGARSRAAEAAARATALSADPARDAGSAPPAGLAGLQRDVRDRAAEAVQQGTKRNEAADD